jgi:hypothetical protein
MQTLALEIAITFVEDGKALVRGSGRIAVRILMAPVERIANACDVADMLRQSRSSNHGQRNQMKRIAPSSNAATQRPRRRRWPLRHRLFSFRSLSDLT